MSGRSTGLILLRAAIVLAFLGSAGCGHSPANYLNAPADQAATLEQMGVGWGANLKFDQDFLVAFGERHGIKTHFIPNTRLEVYRQLLRAHSGKPDLLEVDIVWPSILGDDLVDLKPYVQDAETAFPSDLLNNYTVRGRLVALPVYVDIGVLYYRPDLLAKYGFHKPPETWDDLEKMAGRIQAGERQQGNKDFWGYVWQGSASEGGTCNALEWQASAGAGTFIEGAGAVNVRDVRFAMALAKVANWIGTISPPAEYVYHEDDSVNLWDAGQTAFMRNWASGYDQLARQRQKDHRPFSVTPMPAGPGGHRGTVGGIGIGVSKYAANPQLAIQALLELTSEQNDLARFHITGGIPTRLTLFERPDVKSHSPLLAVSAELMRGSVSRPALAAREDYEQVSLEYAEAVNLVLRRQATPQVAMAELERKLIGITGLPALAHHQRDGDIIPGKNAK